MQKQHAPGTATVFNVCVACLEAYSLYFFKVLQFSGNVFMCTSIYDLLDSLYMYVVYTFSI